MGLKCDSISRTRVGLAWDLITITRTRVGLERDSIRITIAPCPRFLAALEWDGRDGRLRRSSGTVEYNGRVGRSSGTVERDGRVGRSSGTVEWDWSD